LHVEGGELPPPSSSSPRSQVLVVVKETEGVVVWAAKGSRDRHREQGRNQQP